MSNDFDDTMDIIHANGLYLNNLMELKTGDWRASLTDHFKYFQFGEGATALRALKAAFIKATTEEGSPAYVPPVRTQAKTQSLFAETAIDLGDIDLS